MPDETNQPPQQALEPTPAVEQQAPAPTPPVEEPVVPPAAPETAQAPIPKQSSTVVLVWQWLTYGLWSWTLASLGVLLSSTLAYFITSDARNGNYTWLVYVIATMLCLLPVSYLIDRTYSKHEPDHKTGFAAVILVIHAVLAFLVSIGALITAVVTMLSIATDTSSDTSVKVTVIVSALLIALLGGLFFARIVRPAKLAGVTRRFPLIVSVIAAITIVAALAGPYVATVQSKTDRQIESGLYSVNNAIQDYARENKKLPATLSDVTFSSYENDAKTIVKKNLVEYNQKGEDTTVKSLYSHTYKYELCVAYKHSKGTGKVPASSYPSGDSSYYLETFSHPKGHTCYQQTAYVTGSASSSSKSLYSPLSN